MVGVGALQFIMIYAIYYDICKLLCNLLCNEMMEK